MATKSVGSVVGDLGLNTVRWSAGIRKAESSMERFTKRSTRQFRGLTNQIGGSVVSSVGKLAGALAAVVGPAALGALTAVSARNIDQQQKFADRIGVSQKALAGLQLAASQTAGMTDSQLNLSLQRMTRRVAEAAAGTGEAKNAIKQLGLSAVELAQMSPDKQFLRISDAMKNVSSSGEQVRLAFKLFDSEGVAVVNTLRQGSSEIERYVELSDKLGLSVSRVDAAKIEQMNDTLELSRKAFAGVGNSIAIELAPVITAVAQKFVEAAQEGDGMGKKVLGALEGIFKGAGFVLDVFNGLSVVFSGLKAGAALLAQGFWNIAKALVDGLLLPLRGVASSLLKANESFSVLSDGIKDTLEVLAAPGEFLLGGIVEQSAKNATKAVEEFNRKLAEPPPSEGLAKWVIEVKAAAQEVAEAVAAAQAGRTADIDTEGVDLLAKENAQKDLDRLLENHKTKMQLEQELFAERLDILNTNLALENISKSEHFALEIQELQAHFKRKQKIEQESESASAKFSRMTAVGKTKTVLGELVTMTQGVAQHNRTLFNINKVAAIANATVSAFEGASKSRAAYPEPLGSIMAGISLAAGLANVAAISSTSFSGGGGGSTPSAVGSVPVLNDTPLSPQRQELLGIGDGQQLQQEIIINVGNGGRVAEALAEEIQVMVGENDLELIPSGSRNAQDIRGAA